MLAISPRVAATRARRPIALVVEDDPAARTLIMKSFERLGCSAHGCGSAESALAWLAMHDAPEIVSVDIVLPWMCGLRFTEAMRADPRLAHTPVVVISARTGMADEASALEAGADDVLAKPFRWAEFEATVAPMIAAVELHLSSACS